MAGAIAHYFKNQLQAVMGNPEMVIGDLPESVDTSEALAEALKAAGKASEVSRLVADLPGTDARQTGAAGFVRDLPPKFYPASIRGSARHDQQCTDT
jgi:hypothetical protein